MPYFVFKISTEKKLTLLDVYEKYNEAKTICTELRKKQNATDTDQVRMAFAKSEKEAKNLLTEKHKPSSPLEEWEA